jgi:hypothetical protein
MTLGLITNENGRGRKVNVQGKEQGNVMIGKEFDGIAARYG